MPDMTSETPSGGENLIPADLLEELCRLFPEGSIEIHWAGEADEEYHYLREGEICLTAKSPGGEKLFLDLTDEFTLSFGAFHAHYAPDVSEYREMLADLRQILENKVCSGALYWFSGGEKKWLGSTLVSRQELSRPVKEVISFVLRQKEFRQKLREHGGEARFSFWDPADDLVAEIPRQR